MQLMEEDLSLLVT